MKNIKLLQTKLLKSFDYFIKRNISYLLIFYISLTIFTLLCLYFSFFGQVILCDSIQELKDNIQWDLANLKDACHDYETLSHMYDIQKLRILHSGNSLGLSDINWDVVSRALGRNNEAQGIIKNIWRSVTIIRIKEPGFKPPLWLILQRYETRLNARAWIQNIR